MHPVQILAYVYAARTQPRQDRLQSDDLVTAAMTAIVDHYVDRTIRLQKISPEPRVPLIPDHYRDPVGLVRLAGGVDIDARDP
jgi:hypothetical protein